MVVILRKHPILEVEAVDHGAARAQHGIHGLKCFLCLVDFVNYGARHDDVELLGKTAGGLFDGEAVAVLQRRTRHVEAAIGAQNAVDAGCLFRP